MSARLGSWLLIALSLACTIGLNLGVAYKWDRWTATPFAVLAHGAILPAIAAAGLSMRLPRCPVRTLSRVLGVIALIAWAQTWFTPLQKLFAWVSTQWYLWMGV